jgi:hypothetical protein
VNSLALSFKEHHSLEHRLILQLQEIIQEENDILKNVTEIGLFYEKSTQLTNIVEAFLKELVIRNLAKNRLLEKLNEINADNRNNFQEIENLSLKCMAIFKLDKEQI